MSLKGFESSTRRGDTGLTLLLLFQRCKLISLIFSIQRLYHRCETAGKNFIQFIQCQINAVISDPALWIIIGADAFGTIPTANETLALFSLLAGLLLGFLIQYFCLQE